MQYLCLKYFAVQDFQRLLLYALLKLLSGFEKSFLNVVAPRETKVPYIVDQQLNRWTDLNHRWGIDMLKVFSDPQFWLITTLFWLSQASGHPICKAPIH